VGARCYFPRLREECADAGSEHWRIRRQQFLGIERFQQLRRRRRRWLVRRSSRLWGRWAKAARNAVATAEGVPYVADGPDGKILVVKPVKLP
jgi:predicted secreted protein